MKRFSLLIVLNCWMLTQISCLTLLQPLVTTDVIITDNRIVGKWMDDEKQVRIDASPDSYFFKELAKSTLSSADMQPLRGKDKEDSVFYSQTYTISFHKDISDYYMIGALMKVGGNLFIDLYPLAVTDSTSEDGGRFFDNIDYLPTFSIAKLEISGNDKLKVSFIDGNFIREQIANGKMRIKHVREELFDNFLITASSNELQQFLHKYGNDERLFSKDYTLTLIRKGS